MSRSSAQEMKPLTKLILLVSMIFMCAAGNAFALEETQTKGRDDRVSFYKHKKAHQQSASSDLFVNRLASKRRNEIPPVWLAQRGQGSSSQAVRSKSDVVRDVKQRYNAQVLKITLDQNKATYRVRLLLPSGRIKEVSVSAKR